MGNVNRFVLIMALVLGMSSAKAFNPYTSSIIFERIGNDWFMDISASQLGTYEVLKKYYGTEDISMLSIAVYKEKYFQYLNTHIHLVADDFPVELLPVDARLGSRQAEVRFVLKGIPRDFDELSVKLNVFEENGSQQNITGFFSEKGNVSSILNAENEFSTRIVHRDGKYILSDGFPWNMGHLLYVSVLLVFTLVLFFVLRYYTNKKSTPYKGPVLVYKRQ